MRLIGQFVAFEPGDLYRVSDDDEFIELEIGIRFPLLKCSFTGNDHILYLSYNDNLYHVKDKNIHDLDKIIGDTEVSPENLSTLLQILQRVLVKLDVKQEEK